jgi:hypothetical protein
MALFGSVNPAPGHAEMYGEPVFAELNQRPFGKTADFGDGAACQVGVHLLLSRPGGQRGPPPCKTWVLRDFWVHDHKVQ